MLRPGAMGCSLAFAALLMACGTERVELGPEGQAVTESGSDEVPHDLAPPPGSSNAVPAASEASEVVVAAVNGERPPVSGAANLESPPARLPLAPGCKKVDFLFVVDNSASMRGEQSKLLVSFPEFISVVQQTLQIGDFHIMVLGTDGRALQPGDPLPDAQACEEVLGAGRRRSLDGEECGLTDGAAFMTDTQLNLRETFSCAAQVGTDGDADSEPMAAMLAAIGPELNGKGACNAGFFRDDAVLVVTFISDEEDDDSTGEPEDWHRLLLDAKRGNEDALVVLGLIGDNNKDNGLCSSVAADAAPRLQEFVARFGRRGLEGSVCAPSYGQFFAKAVGWVDGACRDFVTR